MISRRVTFWRIGVLILLCGVSVGAGTVRLSKRTPHLNLRAQLSDRQTVWEFDRWFLPGKLGVELRTPGGKLDSSSELLAPSLQPPVTSPQPSDRSFLTRAFSGVSDSDWKLFNHLTPALRFSHNLNKVFPASLFDEQPELFPMVDGQRMKPGVGPVNWNPDLGGPAVAQVAADAAMKYFAENPDAVSFGLGINDGLRFGESPATLHWVEPLRWFRDRPDYSDLIFNFMNEVAERTVVEWPDKYVGALAYYWAENRPSFPLHPRVIPFLTADRSQFYDRKFRREELLLQTRWGKIFENTEKLKTEKLILERGGSEELATSDKKPETSRQNLGDSDEQPVTSNQQLEPRLGLYDYIYGAGFLIPRIHPHALAEHLRRARQAGFTDYYAEVYPNWGLDGPQPWVVSQLLLDPEQSVDRLLREYYRRYFKNAERPMRRFFERCESIWMHQSGQSYWLKHFRNDSQAALFPPEVCHELRGVLDDAKAKAGEGGRVAERVKLVSDAFGVTERFSRFHVARDALQRGLVKVQRSEEGDEAERPTTSRPAGLRRALQEDGGLAFSAVNGEKVELEETLREFETAKAEFIWYLEWLKGAQPLALSALSKWGFGDFLRHDPGPTAEAILNGELLEGDKIGREEAQEVAEFGWSDGALQPALDIAGLPYTVALPNPWRSSVEPWQGLIAELREFKPEDLGSAPSAMSRDGGIEGLSVTGRKEKDVTHGRSVGAEENEVGGDHSDFGGRILRLVNNKLTTMTRTWYVTPDAVRTVAVEVRGKLSESAFLALTLRPYNAAVEPLAPPVDVKFYGDESLEWATLAQSISLPAETQYLAITFWCAHQQAGDWLEVGEPQLLKR